MSVKGLAMFTLDQVLGLVGVLDDSPGPDTPRERFRAFLRASVTSIGTVRDYVEYCAKNKGAQYDFALQDLINHTGALIGFDVEFGRFRGVTNDIGHDGLWHWNGFSIVVEVKTTDAFTIRTETLLGYVNRLISAGKVRDWDHAMGLYIFGRSDAELKSLANSIVAEKRTHELRIATADTLLSLAELVQDRQITRDEAVTLLKPGGVFVSDTVRLLSRIAAEAPLPEPVEITAGSFLPSIGEPEEIYSAGPAREAPRQQSAPIVIPSTPFSDRLFLITPVRDEDDITAKSTIASFLNAGWYVFGEKTPGRKRLKTGDRICFYESGVGVVAEAEIASVPERKPPTVKGLVKNVEKYPWSFRLTNVRLFFDQPRVIDANVRSKLDAFEGRDPTRSWAWFVQGTKVITEHDYQVLTGKMS
jgi:hypothetical protein